MTLVNWLLLFGSLVFLAIIIDCLRLYFTNSKFRALELDEVLALSPSDQVENELPHIKSRLSSQVSLETQETTDEANLDEHLVNTEYSVTMGPDHEIETNLEPKIEYHTAVETSPEFERQTLVVESGPDTDKQASNKSTDNIVHQEVIAGIEQAEAKDFNPAFDPSFDPTRPVYEALETSPMVQADLFADTTMDVHDDDILFADLGITETNIQQGRSAGKKYSVLKHFSQMNVTSFGRKKAAKKKKQASQTVSKTNTYAGEGLHISIILFKASQGILWQQLVSALQAKNIEYDADQGRFAKYHDEYSASLEFTIINSKNDGCFAPNTDGDHHIKGVIFCMALPCAEDPLTTLEAMVTTARHIANTFKAELYDIDKSVLCPQTLRHFEQRIKEYERRCALATSISSET